ncbi:Trp biosynthesis-associated membrane protein [Sanguibacter sp. A247]|uniref:Trp biosynthesis-associated membrane protein n=1 Tax=unclassified Sanguibacter TaxID=2645534 RepID=UPI003FD8341E
MADRSRVGSRRSTVLGAVIVGTGMLGVSAPVWVTASGTSALSSVVEVTVSGGAAAPGVQAAGLVLLAAAAAALLVGRWGAWTVAGVLGLGGVVAIASAIPVLTSPVNAARAAASEATGVDVLVSDPVVSAVAWLAPALGLAALVLAVAAATGASSWRTGSRRHEREAGAPAASVSAAADDVVDLAALWDEPDADDGDDLEPKAGPTPAG